MIRLSIRTKIFIIIFFILGLVLTLVYDDLTRQLSQQAYESIQSHLSKELNLATHYINQIYPLDDSIEQVDAIADSLGKDLSLRVTIIRDDGVVLGDSQLGIEEIRKVENHLYRPEIQQAIETSHGMNRRYSKTINIDMLYMARFLSNERFQGFIRLSVPLSDIAMIDEKLKKTMVTAFGGALVLALLLSFLSSAFLSKSIRELSAVTKGIAQGHFTHHILLQTNDEIQDLSRSINEMSDQIKARMEDVLSHKSKLETILMSMFDGLLVVDPRGEIVLINDSLKKLFHIQQNPMGCRPLEIVRNVQVQELVDKVLGKKQGVESRQVSVFLPEEKILWIHATPIIREGKNDGAVLVFHDITELRRLEKVRQDFVANVSHELRTPISTIKGYAETLLDGALDDKTHAKEFLEIIHNDVNRLANLINDLLDLARIESGKIELEFTAVNLKDLADQTIQTLSPQIQKKGISVKNFISNDFSKVRADKKSLSQVLFNLMDNAVKYNKQSGSIMISAQNQKNNMILVSVADTGEGIPEKDLPRIFERFYRVDKARSYDLGGTGLGLAIVKHIIQAHGGDVSVQSQLEQGTTFQFTLPQA
ncbi:MAG TPA: ATP-binding protein [Candidatus Omnitrophota bacterium]|nr:ATP-binding protein [Candidatus Omnitrophota bacterium]